MQGKPVLRLALIGLFTLTVAGCQDTKWIDQTPSYMRGIWVEQTDPVLKGIKVADTVRIGRDAIRYVRYAGFEVSTRRRCAPIHTVSKTGSQFILFCGRENENHIAETRLRITVGEDKMTLYIADVVARGVQPSEPVIFEWGRFGPP